MYRIVFMVDAVMVKSAAGFTPRGPEHTSKTITHNDLLFHTACIHFLFLFWHLFYDCLHIKYLNKQNLVLGLRFAQGWWGGGGGVREEEDGWWHSFRKWAKKRRRAEAAAAVERQDKKKKKKKSFAWLQSKRAEEGSMFFRLRLAAAVTDGCVCTFVHDCECWCVFAHCRRAHPSAFPGDSRGCGRRPWWLIKCSTPHWSNINCAATAKKITAPCKVTRAKETSRKQM